MPYAYTKEAKFRIRRPLPGEYTVIRMGWEWPIKDSHENHSERAALLRPIVYEMTSPEQCEQGSNLLVMDGTALSLNISSGGMLVLMDKAPDIEQVLKVYVPTPIAIAETPTLAEVRWTRKFPFEMSNGHSVYFVGLKFMF